MAASSNCSSRQATLPPLTPCVWMFSRTPKKFVFCLLVVPLNQFGKHGIQYFNEQPSIPRLAAASDTMLEQPSSLVWHSTDLYSLPALLKAAPTRRAMLQIPEPTSEPVPAPVKTVQT